MQVSLENKKAKFALEYGNINEEDREMGYIYVAKTKSKKYKTCKDFYKIGKTEEEVDVRLASASNESTFLFAEAVEAGSRECPDENLDDVEECVKSELEDYHWPITVTKKGKNYTAEEWYKGATLTEIMDAIDSCIEFSGRICFAILMHGMANVFLI